MAKKPTKANTQKLALIPGMTHYATRQTVQLIKIPGLIQITNPSHDLLEGVFVPLCGGPLVATSNSDGTYSLLNDTRMLEPELSRMNPSQTELWVLEPDQDEYPLRLHLGFVASSRSCMTHGEFKKVFLAGNLAPLAERYRCDRHAHTYAGAAALNPSLPRSTFNYSTEKCKSQANEPDTEDTTENQNNTDNHDTQEKKATVASEAVIENEAPEPKPAKKTRIKLPQIPEEQGNLF